MTILNKHTLFNDGVKNIIFYLLLFQIFHFAIFIEHSDTNPVQPIPRISLEKPEAVENTELYVDVGGITWHGTGMNTVYGMWSVLVQAKCVRPAEQLW